MQSVMQATPWMSKRWGDNRLMNTELPQMSRIRECCIKNRRQHYCVTKTSLKLPRVYKHIGEAGSWSFIKYCTSSKTLQYNQTMCGMQQSKDQVKYYEVKKSKSSCAFNKSFAVNIRG